LPDKNILRNLRIKQSFAKMFGMGAIELIVGIGAILAGIGLLLGRHRDAQLKKDMIWEFKKRDILQSWYQQAS
jgi:hypothetical protein